MDGDRTPSARARTVTLALLVAYLVGLTRVTLWPRLGTEDPFGVVRTTLAWLNAHSVPLTYEVTELVANIVLFVPFGILVALLLPRRPAWTVIGLGLATSTVIELTQLVFLPDRVADVRDLVANTLGAAVGVALRHVAGRRSGARRPAPAATG
ncbi:VanZ family protein [Cellulomonas fengjieae]|uniref:VanZ family protein n=1 Tax=Cellulomonas fengjieae TaxID=2819978 RepID=A0ABS3SMD8_9CELL|nr:VanZ family protein [Cellulomonas fengjieae]MBO3086654.1 VanZ family protein [Cellulomonas fengjieae]QVI66498.1 VanZ family protein [Cellulomonas fengjieae]